jgi:hypothetical protein
MDSALDKIKKLVQIKKIEKLSVTITQSNCSLMRNIQFDSRIYNNVVDVINLGEKSICREIYQKIIDELQNCHLQRFKVNYNENLLIPFYHIINKQFKWNDFLIHKTDYNIKSICFVTTYKYMNKIKKSLESRDFFQRMEKFNSSIVLLPDDERSIYNNAMGLIFIKITDDNSPLVLNVQTDKTNIGTDIPIRYSTEEFNVFQTEVRMIVVANLVSSNYNGMFWLIEG